MTVQNTDLFVIQDPTDKKFYSLKFSDLISEIELSDSVTFKGSADLNNPPASSGITLPANNGDFYIVQSAAPIIDPGWVMEHGDTEAGEGDRIFYNTDTAAWILTRGSITKVLASLPLESDEDPVEPVISILDARTIDAAVLAGDGKGTAGAVAKLAAAADVASDGTGDTTAVVTADLLKATNIELDTEIEALNDELAAQIEPLPKTAVISVSEGGTDIVANALTITTTDDAGNANEKNVEIGVKQEVFCPYDFSALTNINA